MSIRIIIKIITGLSVLSYGLAAWADLPKATLDDYVWEILPAQQEVYSGEEVCEYPSFAAYQRCRERLAEAHDNQLSKKWKIADQVTRKKATLVITLPNRNLPLTFYDYQDAQYEDANYSYHLIKYDQTKKLLFIQKQRWETSDTAVVDLATGFTQEFEGTDLSFSPNQQHAVTVETYPTGEAIMIWQQQTDGRYEQVALTDDFHLGFHDHLAFYNGSGDERANVTIYQVKMNWLSNTHLLVDFYYKISDQDSAAYRVRFNVVKPTLHSSWQIIPIK